LRRLPVAEIKRVQYARVLDHIADKWPGARRSVLERVAHPAELAGCAVGFRVAAGQRLPPQGRGPRGSRVGAGRDSRKEITRIGHPVAMRRRIPGEGMATQNWAWIRADIDARDEYIMISSS
jgi:hypothetical protein